VTDPTLVTRMCPHCGSTTARNLGECAVCGEAVCSECGSIQIAAGKRTVMHRECVTQADDQFKMIKFVR
jgi:hypothetical protein